MKCLIAVALLITSTIVTAADSPFDITVKSDFNIGVGKPLGRHQTSEFTIAINNSLGSDYSVPDDSIEFIGTKYTQTIFVLDDRDKIIPSLVNNIDDKRWQQPGGMLGVKGWDVKRYRYIPKGSTVKTWIGDIEVQNSFLTGRMNPDGTPEHGRQTNRGIKREYPIGTRFDEVLYNAETNKVFEHRMRIKADDGKWRSTVYFKDEDSRPNGYSGLKVSCMSCHAEAGTGKYDAGLVPGGDTVLSDPFNWATVGLQSPEK